LLHSKHTATFVSVSWYVHSIFKLTVNDIYFMQLVRLGLLFCNNKRLILGCLPPLWDNRPHSLIMAWNTCRFIINKNECIESPGSMREVPGLEQDRINIWKCRQREKESWIFQFSNSLFSFWPRPVFQLHKFA